MGILFATNPIEKYQQALEKMSELIRLSTTSLTSMPKPLKYLSPSYDQMKKFYEDLPNGQTKALCADIISSLAICQAEPRDTVKYRLLGSRGPISDWGHEYIRHLSSEITNEWRDLSVDDISNQKLLELVKELVEFNMKHNGEVEACDLLIEVEQLPLLLEYVLEDNYARVCIYLLR